MDQKMALVTGASEGIGREFSRQLAQHGYAVTAVARNQSRLEQLLKDLPPVGQPHQLCVADLSDSKGVSLVRNELKSRHYDLVINNAGFGFYSQFSEAPLEKLESMIRLNCEALTTLSYEFLKSAKAGDALINVSSVLSFLPLPGSSVYAATKAFVTSFSESLWYEQKARGVYVMSLCPGATASEFHSRAGGKTANRPPSFMTQTCEQVVRIALKNLKKRKKPTVICGSQNKLTTVFTRMISRKRLVSLMGQMRT